MEKLIVKGGNRLNGHIKITAAKNAVLPILACCILSKKQIILHNCTPQADTFAMLQILKSIGASADFFGSDIIVDCKNANSSSINSKLTSSIRSSIFILGPILSRFKSAKISYPGGCEIGLRPIDLHLSGLKSLNANIIEENGYIVCDGKQLKNGVVSLDLPSVGATENIIMASALTSGTTIIHNAAREPEIVDLANFINTLGGKVQGAGTSTIIIEGVAELGGGEYTPISDRIVAGTYLIAGAMCGGKVQLDGINPQHLLSLTQKLTQMGCKLNTTKNTIKIASDGANALKALNKIETQYYPGFATDLQPQMVSLLSCVSGNSVVIENLFESRYKYTAELNKMGADIKVVGRAAIINGVKALTAAEVDAFDLRGGASVVLAALTAEGTSTINSVHHIDRGYFRIENDLTALGAQITRE